MFRSALIPLALVAASAIAVPVTFSPTGDSGKGSIVANGDSAEFTKTDALVIKAKFGDTITLANEGDSIALTGDFEMEGAPIPMAGALRFALLSAPPQGDTDWLGYFCFYDSGRVRRRDGSAPDAGSYMSMRQATEFTPTNSSWLQQNALLPARLLFSMTLTRTKEGLNIRVGMNTADGRVLTTESTDTAPKTFSFNLAGFTVNCPWAKKVTLRHVDVSLRKATDSAATPASADAAKSDNTLLIVLITGATLLTAGGITGFVIHRRRAVAAAAASTRTAPRPPAPPTRLPPPPGAR